MERVRVLTKVSFRYWMRHKKRLLTLALAIVMGVAALCCSALLIRSEKTAELDEKLDYYGNYDAIVYETNRETLERVSEIEEVIDVGFYYELGYATSKTSDMECKIAAYEDQKAQEMHHVSCIRGRHPVAKDEVSIDLNMAKTLGVAPYPGEQIELVLYDLER